MRILTSPRARHMKKIFLLFILSVFTATAHAQFPLTISGSPVVATGWVSGGSGTGAPPLIDNPDSAYTLTSAVTGEANYLYYGTGINLAGYCQVTADFDFEIVQSGSTQIADGMTFWFLSNPPTSSVPGNAIGLPNYANGLIMVMDTYDNNSTPDNPILSLLGYNGSVYQYVEDASTGVLGTNQYNQNFVDNGAWHHCKLTYNSGTINVYFNNSATPSLSGYYPLAFTGYFGFSGSTGALYSTQRVKNVNITATSVGIVPTVTSPVHYCVGATADTLHATGTGSPLHWFTTDTATVVALPGSPTPNTSVPGTYWYFVRQGTAGCISAPDSVQVIVSAIPAAPVITGTTFYCSGTTAVPFSVTGTGILWYSTPTGTGSSTAPTVPTGTPGTYTYYASQTVAGCTSPLDSIQVTVNAVPAAPTMTAGNLTYCQFNTFVPFTIAGTNVLWYTTPTGGTGTGTAPVVNTSVAGTYNYYVTQTVGGCESPRLALPVVVNAKPAAPAVMSPTYCQYVGAAPLSATGGGLVWYGPGVTAGYTTVPTPTTGAAGVVDYYVTQTVLGCTSDSATIAVTTIAKPAAPVTADTSYCQFTTAAPLTATGVNLSWYTSATGGAASSTAPVPPTNLPGTTTWYVSQTVNGCESDRTPLNVTTYFMPVFNITSSQPFACQYDSLTLSYSGPALVSDFNWTLPAGAYFANGDTSTTSVTVIKFNAAGDNNFVYLTASGPGGRCSATDSIDIKVVPQPAATLFTKDNACVGDTIGLALSSQTSNAAQFTWTVDGNPLNSAPAINIVSANANTGGPFKVSWNTTGIHVVTVYAYSTEGCRSKPSLDTVKVLASPDATFGYLLPNGQFCIEDSVLFKANDSNAADLFYWTPAHAFNNVNSPEQWGKVELADGSITLTVTNANGCTASTSQEMTPGTCCTVAFPMAFSPNADHHNDVFRPIAPGYHRFHNLRIVNRWGQTVFESTNTNMEWDGTYNGVPQDMGVYYYFVKYDCGGQTFEQKGDVTLVR